MTRLGGRAVLLRWKGSRTAVCSGGFAAWISRRLSLSFSRKAQIFSDSRQWHMDGFHAFFSMGG